VPGVVLAAVLQMSRHDARFTVGPLALFATEASVHAEIGAGSPAPCYDDSSMPATCGGAERWTDGASTVVVTFTGQSVSDIAIRLRRPGIAGKHLPANSVPIAAWMWLGRPIAQSPLQRSVAGLVRRATPGSPRAYVSFTTSGHGGATIGFELRGGRVASVLLDAPE